MSDTPSIPTTDKPEGVTFEQRKDRAFFSLGYLTGCINGRPDEEEVAKAHLELREFIRHAQWLYEEDVMGDQLRSKLSDLLTRTANVLKGEPGPLSSHSWHDLPESAALAMDPDKKAIRHAGASLSLWWAMVEADAELAGEPLQDDQIALHFMGSGASHIVNVKDIRALMTAIYGPALPENKDTHEQHQLP